MPLRQYQRASDGQTTYSWLLDTKFYSEKSATCSKQFFFIKMNIEWIEAMIDSVASKHFCIQD